MKAWLFVVMALVGIMLLDVSGCATSSNIKEPIPESMSVMIEEPEIQVEESHTEFGHTTQTAKVTVEPSEDEFPLEAILAEETVHFRFDRSDLSREAKTVLHHLVRQMKTENKGAQIKIEGHTDDTGEDKYNYTLGLDRAREVRAHLHMQYGIPLHRLSIFTYGESKPIVDNTTPSNRSKNRRVTIVVLRPR